MALVERARPSGVSAPGAPRRPDRGRRGNQSDPQATAEQKRDDVGVTCHPRRFRLLKVVYAACHDRPGVIETFPTRCAPPALRGPPSRRKDLLHPSEGKEGMHSLAALSGIEMGLFSHLGLLASPNFPPDKRHESPFRRARARRPSRRCRQRAAATQVHSSADTAADDKSSPTSRSRARTLREAGARVAQGPDP